MDGREVKRFCCGKKWVCRGNSPEERIFVLGIGGLLYSRVQHNMLRR